MLSPGAPPPMLSDGSTSKTGPTVCCGKRGITSGDGKVGGISYGDVPPRNDSIAPTRIGALSGSPSVTAVKLTPVSGVSAKEKPERTLTARISGCSLSICRARVSRPSIGSAAVAVPVGGHIKEGVPKRCEALAAQQDPVEEPRRADRGRMRIGMRIFAIGNQGIAVLGHFGRAIRMQVEHASQGEILGAGQVADAAQQLSFDVDDRLADHGPMQDEKDAIDAAFQLGPGGRFEFFPKLFDHAVCDGRARRGAKIDQGQKLPTGLARRFDRARQRRAISRGIEQL